MLERPKMVLKIIMKWVLLYCIVLYCIVGYRRLLIILIPLSPECLISQKWVLKIKLN